ncbi:hypothetical protein EU244_012735 [Rhodococcus qingshengii]|uniref:hypothetical protein n=1 Tax=Rhodococcus qingshengii TaxID=334542 RepID=UPI0010A5DA04|nr:hypothetical protein [Rhodococcus qingshengii]THJ69967.1 hypothetical protein EU244_20120 [Rhodococcus qingshengii]
MTDKELGTAAGDIFTTQIAKAIQAKTGGNVEGKLPEWWAEFIGMVLDELQSTGRLIPAGGMALTAEQVEDVRTVSWYTGAGLSRAPMAEIHRLRALFPATEPADEERCDFYAETEQHGYLQCKRRDGHTAHHHIDPPAPAEPAEEETKAHCMCVAPDWYHDGLDSDIGGRLCRRCRLRQNIPYRDPASSPVVPASTEPGPWQRIEDVPDGVEEVSDCDGHLWWLSRNVVEEWHFDGTDPSGTKQFKDPSDFAPLFAVKEES